MREAVHVWGREYMGTQYSLLNFVVNLKVL